MWMLAKTNIATKQGIEEANTYLSDDWEPFHISENWFSGDIVLYLRKRRTSADDARDLLECRDMKIKRKEIIE